MYKIPLKDLKEKIIASGKLDASALDERIKAKISELSGLISEEGAAHIIANELGVSLVTPKEQLKIKDIYAGMRSVSTVGRVVRKFEVREFSKGDMNGKVCSLILGDESGTVRVVFWNDQVEQLAMVKEDDVLGVRGAYVRENRGQREIHLGRDGEIEVNPPGVEVSRAVRQTPTYERLPIEQLRGGEEGVELLATVVQVFDPRFFLINPQTRRRVREGEEGSENAETSYVMNAVLDDGTGTIRGVFWKEQTLGLTGKSHEELSSFKEHVGEFEDVKTNLLGEQVKLLGRVRKNEMFDRLELHVSSVSRADPQEELAKLES